MRTARPLDISYCCKLSCLWRQTRDSAGPPPWHEARARAAPQGRQMQRWHWKTVREQCFTAGGRRLIERGRARTTSTKPRCKGSYANRAGTRSAGATRHTRKHVGEVRWHRSGAGRGATPRRHQGITDLAEEERRRRHTHAERDAMGKAASRRGVKRQAAGKLRPPADVARKLEGRLMLAMEDHARPRREPAPEASTAAASAPHTPEAAAEGPRAAIRSRKNVPGQRTTAEEEPASSSRAARPASSSRAAKPATTPGPTSELAVLLAKLQDRPSGPSAVRLKEISESC